MVFTLRKVLNENLLLKLIYTLSLLNVDANCSTLTYLNVTVLN